MVITFLAVFTFAISLIQLTAASPLPWTAPSPLKWVLYDPKVPNLFVANISVPLDWDNPSGTHINLTIGKVPTNNTMNRVGSVVIQFGGPGDTTFSALTQLATQPNTSYYQALSERFDIIVQDARGVGFNHPVQCDLNFTQLRLSPFPKTEQEWTNYIDAYATLGQSCIDMTGPVINYLDTITQAKDLEAVRLALDEGKLNYYGLSWGTQRGSQYLNLYPQNIRSMVLDSIVNHGDSSVSFGFSETVGFSLTMRRFLEWAKANSTSALYGKDTITLYHNLIQQANEKPIPVPPCPASSPCFPNVTGTDIQLAALNGIQYPAENDWILFAQALLEASNGNATAFRGGPVQTQTNANSLFSNIAISCQDWYPDTTWTQFQDRQQMLQSSSLDPQGDTYARDFSLRCLKWPTKVRNPPAPINVTNASAPVLIVHALWDPATSYSVAVETQRQINGSILLTRNGEGHGSYEFPESRQAMNDYLINLKLPAPNTVVDKPWCNTCEFGAL